jgi:dihydropteroate synthase
MTRAAVRLDLRLPASTCDADGCRLKVRALSPADRSAKPRLALAASSLRPDEEALLRSTAGVALREAGRELFVELPSDLGLSSGVIARLTAAWANSTAAMPTPLIMGIVNATPDSFSDGGQYHTAGDTRPALDHALSLVEAGCDLLDIGGESTRPGATPVDEGEELRRVIPLISSLASATGCPISVDTRKAAVAAAAIDAGATMVNDISAGLHDPQLLPLVAERGVGICLMHMQGTPADMQDAPRYDDVVCAVLDHLRLRVSACLKAGIEGNKIRIDPGIGFGKTLEHNLELIQNLPVLRSLGLPLLLGVSRKSFIAQLNQAAGIDSSGGASVRLGGTLAACLRCADGGASVLRVHDVAALREALLVHRSLSTEPS